MIHVTELARPLAPAGTLVDFGLDAYAALEVEIDLKREAELELAIGEVLNPDGTLNEAPGGWRIVRTMKRRAPAGPSRFAFELAPHRGPNENTFTVPVPPEAGGEVIPFRYVQIKGGEGTVKLRRRELFDDFDDAAAHFSCSDPRLNRVWEFCRYTMKATSALGVFVDGERERCPYEGDAYINQLGWFCCTPSAAIARRTIDWFEILPTWPVEWRLLTPLLVRDYLLYTGDEASVRNWLRWLPARLLPELEQPYGFLRGNDRVREIVDWPEGFRDGYVFGPFNFVPNAYYVKALEAMAELTGNTAYAAKANSLRARLRARFFAEGLPADSTETRHTSLHSAVFALWAEIAEDPAPLCKLIRAKGMACSVFAAQFLLDVSFRYGMADHGAALMTGNDLHSWLHMLDCGATIAMEAWDDSLKPNQDWNHAWGAAPANIIPRRLCGVRPTAPGFRRFTVDPQPGPVTDFELRQPTPLGPVEVTLEGGRQLKIAVPEGAEALYRGRVLAAGRHTLAFA